MLAAGLAGAAAFCGCEMTEDHSGTFAKEVGDRNLTDMPTAELKERRTEVLRRYGEIQRSVEMKAGLTMGIAMTDERAQLGELYREAHEIERELLRRFSQGDPDVTAEQVKVSGNW